MHLCSFAWICSYLLTRALGIAKWAREDASTMSQGFKFEKLNHFHYNNSVKRRNAYSSGFGTDWVPADHQFMKRLFKKWAVDDSSTLNLQSVVSGFAPLKGTRDIMSTIAYFFDLYDDDKDGKIDRDSILAISEALLFLSRQGVEGTLTPVASSTDFRQSTSSEISSVPGEMADVNFLSSVSAFIRRCFEYADPDHPSNKDGVKEENVIDGDEKAEPIAKEQSKEDNLSQLDDDKSLNQDTSLKTDPQSLSESRRSSLKPYIESANAALDPANPLHITLPTFRMVILADETLERFFDSSFVDSFLLSSAPLPATGLGSTNLTTFSRRTASQLSLATNAPAPGPGLPPGKGLRGMLDNLVSDGMRVASEVKRRVDEAQREVDRAGQNAEEDEDDEEATKNAGAYGGDAERRSVREADRDLLEGAEADAGVVGESGTAKESLLDSPNSDIEKAKDVNESDVKNVIEFER